MTQERRKTKHLTQWYKDYIKAELSKVMGIELDETQAWNIFKLCMKSPMRFLDKYVGEEDLDMRGEKAVALPGVGKFKFMKTVPQGKMVNGQKVLTKNTFEDGLYPRLKFYPAPEIENEVEVIHGLADAETKEAHEKKMLSEEKHLKATMEGIAKKIKALAGNVANQPVEVREKTLQECIADLVNTAVNNALKAHGVEVQNPSNLSDMLNTPNEDLDEELEEYEDLDNIEDGDTDGDEEGDTAGDAGKNPEPTPQSNPAPVKPARTRKAKADTAKKDEVKPAGDDGKPAGDDGKPAGDDNKITLADTHTETAKNLTPINESGLGDFEFSFSDADTMEVLEITDPKKETASAKVIDIPKVETASAQTELKEEIKEDTVSKDVNSSIDSFDFDFDFET